MSGREIGLVEAPNWPMLRSQHDIFGATLMSNCDREVDQNIAQRLRTEQVLAKYAGWNFNADCWFADGWFCAAVYTHHVHRATFSARTPEDLMQLVSEQFGWD